MVGNGGMEMAFASPILWLIIALVVSASAMTIIRACVVDGTLGAASGIGLLIGLVCGAAIVLSSGGAFLALLLGTVLMILCGAWPALSHFIDRKSRADLRKDDIESYERALAFDPKNASAHAGLAEKLVELNRLDEAVDEYRMAIRLLPDGMQTSRWKSQLRAILDQQKGIDRYDFAVCAHCQKDIPKKTKLCPHCGEIHQMNPFEFALKGENFWPSMRDGFLVMTALISFASFLMVLPREIAGSIVMLCVVAGGWWILSRMSA